MKLKEIFVINKLIPTDTLQLKENFKNISWTTAKPPITTTFIEQLSPFPVSVKFRDEDAYQLTQCWTTPFNGHILNLLMDNC